MAEKQSSTHPLITVLKESGAIIAFFTGLLFIWGYLLFAFINVESRLPAEAWPDFTVPEYMVFGAIVAVTYFLPVIFLGYLVMAAINKITRGRIAKFFSNADRTSPFNPVLWVFLLFLVSVASIIPIARHIARGIHRARVRSVTPSSNSKLATTKYEGLFFVAKVGPNYVFVDKVEQDATVYFLNETEVSEIIFSRASEASPQATP